jgi:hypothetical protein
MTTFEHVYDNDVLGLSQFEEGRWKPNGLKKQPIISWCLGGGAAELGVLNQTNGTLH